MSFRASAILAATATCLLCGEPALAALTCPAAPGNVAKDVVVDTEVSAQGLKSLVTGTLKNHTETTVRNLWEKYPNADRLSVATLMMSVYCQQIDQSTTLTDQEKLDRLMAVNQSIITLMKP